MPPLAGSFYKRHAVTASPSRSDCSWAHGFRRCFTPLSGCFSPFPHGTGSLSVTGECSALEGGPPRFGPGFTCPGLLGMRARGGGGAAYGALARSGRPFHAVPLPAPFVTPRGACGPPARAPATPAGQRPQACAPPPVWAGALSLAATRAISVDFSSSGYLDVSVPRVASPGPMDSGPGRAGTTPPGFPHSETCGSRAVCASPQLIAAYRVLLRLPVPRHPPCARSIFAPPLNTVSLESRPQVFVSHTALLARSRMRAARALRAAPPGIKSEEPASADAGSHVLVSR